MSDILQAFALRLPRRPEPQHGAVVGLGTPVGSGDDPITAAALYPRWADFLRPDDIVVAETGTVSMGLGFAHLPAGVSFYNQTLW